MALSKFLLASGNSHKAQEFNQLFGEGLIVESASEKLEVIEDGETFQENALLKARAYFERFKTPVMSDDSGLIVNALPNELGIHSARFGGESTNYPEKMELLLKKLQGMADRSACFVCYLCCFKSPEEVFFFEGRMDGEIASEVIGAGGFGYDPVFLPKHAPKGKSLAEIPDWKNQHSHRAQAAKQAQKFFLTSCV